MATARIAEAEADAIESPRVRVLEATAYYIQPGNARVRILDAHVSVPTNRLPSGMFTASAGTWAPTWLYPAVDGAWVGAPIS